MTIAQEKQPTIIPENVIIPVSDLYSDEPPLESKLHLLQIIILMQCLEWLWQDRDDFLAAGNLTIYYSPNQKKSEYFKSPDFFVALNTKQLWKFCQTVPLILINFLRKSSLKILLEILTIFGLNQTMG